VADDNATNRKLVVTLLRQRGHEVVVAADGKQAVARSAEQAFDVILMDVQMPEVNGLEATATIRRRERGPGTHVPIIAMTAHAMTGDRERCLSAGMDGYVSKPLRPDELFAAIDRALGDGRPSRAAVPAAAGESRTGEDGTPPTPATALDVPALVASFRGNRQLLREVIDVFLADTPSTLEAARRALAAGDTAALAASAHTLKGSIGLFGPGPAYDAAQRLDG
jgi:CheY-like chemotaxis protein